MKVLISGASIAGPVLAYWLDHYGFDVTVVERAPRLRKAGGHAVDLFRPAVEIAERMGVLPRVEARSTETTRLTVYRQGTAKPSHVDLSKVFSATSDRHVEIMRDDLGEIFHDATADRVEYLFGDSITGIDDGLVTFEHHEPRRFDVVVGADGLHSNVRRLVFDEQEEHFIGAYLAVLTTRKTGLDGEMISHMGPGRMAGRYGAKHLDDERVVLLFRQEQPFEYHYRDVPRQKQIVQDVFGGMHPQVDEWLAELATTQAFYFDSITQLRMDTWSRGRVTLVGDAGYCPGPAVGGSTSLAVLGAYVLAGELAAAGGDHERAFPAYEREMGDIVRQSRDFALGAAKTLIPSSRLGVWGLVVGARVISALPAGVSRALAKLNQKGVRMHDSMTVKDYQVALSR
jgi:2-polyprenyl-6-methoxyphenol hydroxylase-like FAD-dependent oxidoreductase